MKVLLIDDDPVSHLINEKFISIATEDPKLEIITYLKADEALNYTLQYLNSHSSEYLCIFLDLNMPDFNGWDFLNYLEELDDKKLSVFILTSSVSKIDRLKAREYTSVKKFLVKPLSIPLLKNIFPQTKIAS
ncbi:response regulator [Salegentibacter sp.]|uniref:response regulator n=1 Tax=Salegentibacter sp. TaxID=1903072 RepID=UPI003567EEAB